MTSESVSVIAVPQLPAPLGKRAPRTAHPGTQNRGPAREDFDEVAERYAGERRRVQGRAAQRLRDEMIRVALPLAGRLARRYRGGSEPLADLEQVARVGLVKAVDRYDPERGSFTAYAVNTVLGELKRHLRDHSWGVHVPRRMQELALELSRHEADLAQRLGRRPTDAEVIERTGLEAGMLDRVRVSAAGFRPFSLSTPVGDTNTAFGDLLGDPDGALESAADRLTVAKLTARLPERERYIVISTFYGGQTQARIAEDLGVSQMQVSRLLSRALAWMREGLTTDAISRRPPGAAPADAPFTMTVRLLPTGDLEVDVSGEVDGDSAGHLGEELLDLIRRQPTGRRMTLRLAEVPLLAAAGVRMLLTVHEAARARGVTVTVAGLRPFVRGIAEMAGLTPMLEPAHRP
jgi:RNA polymerase sigma-B factor